MWHNLIQLICTNLSILKKYIFSYRRESENFESHKIANLILISYPSQGSVMCISTTIKFYNVTTSNASFSLSPFHLNSMTQHNLTQFAKDITSTQISYHTLTHTIPNLIRKFSSVKCKWENSILNWWWSWPDSFPFSSFK